MKTSSTQEEAKKFPASSKKEDYGGRLVQLESSPINGEIEIYQSPVLVPVEIAQPSKGIGYVVTFNASMCLYPDESNFVVTTHCINTVPVVNYTSGGGSACPNDLQHSLTIRERFNRVNVDAESVCLKN
ncbi:hypothetical protein Trydic_g979 [Trypoxylus dichotomus]